MSKQLLSKTLLALALVLISGSVWADDTKTDIMFAKGFGDYTSGSYGAAGTDYVAVANSTNETDVTYAMQVFNGSTGAVRGNKDGASNFSCRNTTTYDGYYISSVSLTVSGGTIDGSTSGRSEVYFGSSVYVNPSTAAPTGTATSASPASSGQSTLTWTNSDETASYFILYNLKTNQTALSADEKTALTIVWSKKSGETLTPSISADNVNIAYDATGGEISYTIANGVDGGEVSAMVSTGDWLTLGKETVSPISFTCSANSTAAAQTAVVTLTYTYNTDQTVTKFVTVTQAGNPNVVDNISDITAINTNYTIRGTIVAKSARSLVFGDGTGYIYYYNQNYDQSAFNVGDVKKISGSMGSYNHVYQFTSTATIEVSDNSNYNNTPVVQALDATAIGAYNNDLHLSDYVQLEGTLVKSGNYYNLQVSGLSTDASVVYPTTEQAAELDALENKSVIVKGYFAGVSSNHFNVVLESVEEVVSTTPTIVVGLTALTGFTYELDGGPSDAKAFTVSGANLTENITLSLGNSDYEMSLNEKDAYANSLILPQASGEVALTTVYVRLKADLAVASYEDIITITSTGADNKSVSLTGSVKAPEAPHATWNLSIDQTATATEDEMTWVSTFATMAVAKGNATTPTNNYYPGTEGKTYTSTRFYKNSTLTLAPVSGYTITSVVFEATSTNYATALSNSTWTNATASVDNMTVTITPTDEKDAISAVIGGTCGFTEVRVYYVKNEILVTVTNVGYATFYSDYDVAIPAGVTAYYAEDATDGLVMHEVKDGKIKGGVGVVLEAAEKTYYFEATTGAAETAYTALKGVTTATEKSATDAEKEYWYVLGMNGDTPMFFLLEGTLGANKAYYPAPSKKASAMGLRWEGTTNISNMEVTKEKDIYFDLMGRPVQQPQRGIYIVNGKKMLVK